MKYAILGEENIGWSIDNDAKNLRLVLKALENNSTEVNIFQSDVVFIVMWSILRSFSGLKRLLLYKKKVIVFATNDVFHHPDLVQTCKKLDALILVSSLRQRNYLNLLGIKSEVFQYQIDSIFFKKKKNSFLDLKKNEKNILVGSFQRDSLGSDLSKPKWEKNPDFLLEFAKLNPNCKFVLCGPRRHYLINNFRKRKIDYIYIGDESFIDNNKDDIAHNNLAPEILVQLYQLIDFYLVSSLSESGPKAILECIASGTPVYSTRVGLAIDYLSNEFLYDNISDIDLKSWKNSKAKRISTLLSFEEQISFYRRILAC